MEGSHNHVYLQRLITEPLMTFSKLQGKDGDLVSYKKQQYHREAIERGKAFLSLL